MTKQKQALLITIFSLIACVLHGAMLQTPFNDYLYTSIAKVFLFLLIPLLYYKIFKEGTFKELLSLFILKEKRDAKLPLILGGIVFSFIVITFVIIQPLIDSAMVDEALANIGITPGNAFLVVLYIVLINAALEQLFFRGFIFTSLYRMDMKPYAHIYSSVLFAVYHIPVLYHALDLGMLTLATLGLIVAGLIFNWLTVKCRSISGALIVHISANLALNLMIGIYFVFRFF